VGERLHKRLKDTKSSKLLIDHHIQSDEKKAFYDEAVVESGACATAALIYKLSQELNLELDKAESEAIYAGIMSDTGGLRYGSTNKNAFLILSELLDKVKPWEISSNIYENVPVEQLKLLAEVLADMRILANGKAAVIRITREQLKRYSLKPDNVDSFVNFARSVKGAQIAVRFREKGDDLWKVSMRSRGDIDSSAISAEFGGGGHRNAAGFVFKGTFEEGLQKIGEIVNRVAQ
jgi:phosphoesterase RecJ-like protein